MKEIEKGAVDWAWGKSDGTEQELQNGIKKLEDALTPFAQKFMALPLSEHRKHFECHEEEFDHEIARIPSLVDAATLFVATLVKKVREKYQLEQRYKSTAQVVDGTTA